MVHACRHRCARMIHRLAVTGIGTDVSAFSLGHGHRFRSLSVLLAFLRMLCGGLFVGALVV
eukprot:7331302-Pyramimonas_sp.AAC.1